MYGRLRANDRSKLVKFPYLRLLLGLLIVLGSLSSLQVSAQDTARCDELTTYQDAMLAAGQTYVAAQSEDGIDGDRDPLTLSSAEWDAMAGNNAALQAELRVIVPPDWAGDWHQSQVERAGLQEQMAIAASDSGVLVLEEFDDSVAANAAAADESAQAAIQQCTLFLPFQVEWETLEGQWSAAPEPASTGVESDLMEGVTTYDYVCCEHSTETVAYTESPPVGGLHDPAWQTCGFYDAPVRSENVVHSLEHGAVWITYRPELPADQIDQLRRLAGTDDYLLISPYEDQESPIVATAWNNQLEIESTSDPRLSEFITIFLQGPQTPEFGATCSGGRTETVE
jgi:hypothetical protein